MKNFRNSTEDTGMINEKQYFSGTYEFLKKFDTIFVIQSELMEARTSCVIEANKINTQLRNILNEYDLLLDICSSISHSSVAHERIDTNGNSKITKDFNNISNDVLVTNYNNPDEEIDGVFKNITMLREGVGELYGIVEKENATISKIRDDYIRNLTLKYIKTWSYVHQEKSKTRNIHSCNIVKKYLSWLKTMSMTLESLYNETLTKISGSGEHLDQDFSQTIVNAEKVVNFKF